MACSLTASGYVNSDANISEGIVNDDNEPITITTDHTQGVDSGQSASTVDMKNIPVQTTQTESTQDEISKPVSSPITKHSISELYVIVDAIFQAANKDIMTIKQVN